MASKMVDIALKKGDRVRLETPGGGGYGKPQQRDARALEHDRKQGYVGPAQESA